MTTLPAEAASAAQRRASGFRPIADYGLLADCTSSALVDRDGSLDWLCLPHYDSPAVFARILDPEAGHWSITPAGPSTSVRRYLPGTLVLETTFTTRSGSARLVDAMAFAPGQRGHDVGRDAPHEVLRLVEGLSGTVEFELEVAPRPEYGLVRPLFRHEEGGGRTFGGPNQIAVSSGVPVTIEDSTMRARFAVAAGERVGFALHWAAVTSARPMAAPPEAVAARIDDTIEAWRSWEAEHDIYEGPHRDLVRLSARVLKGLTFRPTGAIVAAPTAALPGGRGRRAQLGLPLLLDPRLEPDARGALPRGVLRRGRGLRVLHDELGRRPGRRGLAADHVRDPRRARPQRARARPPARLA